MRKKFKRVMVLGIALCVLSSGQVRAACYMDKYVRSQCNNCKDSSYDSKTMDKCAGKHQRQYGVYFCSECKGKISNDAIYSQRGYSDYNCLGYAMGWTHWNAWIWPPEWGNDGPTISEFKDWINKRGKFSFTTDFENYSGNHIIFVYGKSINGVTRIQHFARKLNMDGLNGEYKTISKWGSGAIYKTKSKNPYTASSGYGNLVLICYK